MVYLIYAPDFPKKRANRDQPPYDSLQQRVSGVCLIPEPPSKHQSARLLRARNSSSDAWRHPAEVLSVLRDFVKPRLPRVWSHFLMQLPSDLPHITETSP